MTATTALQKPTNQTTDRLNEMDRFHLAMDVIDRVPRSGEKGVYLKQTLKDKLVEHKSYIDNFGEDMPEIRNWKWGRSHENETTT